MTEDEARAALFVQALETAPAPEARGWTAEDRRWASREAAAVLGERATPERFIATRAALAVQRLAARDAAAVAWLRRRGWHPAWGVLAVVAGLVAGLAADQLGPPQRVNLLAPAVWAVVAWNLVVYAALLLAALRPARRAERPPPAVGLRSALTRLGLRGPSAVGEAWARHAAPLMTARAAWVLHAAAAALGAALVAGLYLRGLVWDYRAGWQSTFLDAPAVQQGLALLLSPASRLTGIAVPDVAPLRLLPGADATASAAPWIHLYGATLALFVVLPRLALAAAAAARAARLAAHFPLPLDTPYFEGLHPLMRPGLPRVLRLLWAGEAPAGTQLFGAPPPDGAARTLWTSDEGDTLELKPAPPGLPDAPPPARSGLAAWLRPAPADPARALRREVSAVLWAAPPGATPPGGLARLQRPLLVLRTGSAPAGAGELSLQALHDGWLADGRLLAALDAALADDPRWRRLSAAWRARQAARLCETAGALARLLEDTAADREPVLERDREGASAALLQRLQARLAALGVDGAGPAALAERPAPTLRGRVPEGRAAIVGGVLSGALAGLKADVATGGLTMGAGALTGGVLGALGAAGAARGLNAVRGSERPAVEWDDAALATLGRALLAHAAAALPGAAGAGAAERAAAAWPAPPSGRRTPDAAALAAALAGATGGPAWPAA